MKSPRVSVVMPTYGRPTAHRAAASALSQTVGDVELIVVVDPWRCAGDRLPLPEDGRVRTLRPERQGGLGYLPARVAWLRNCGISAAEGEYIAHLDDDNWWSQDHLEKLCELLYARRDCGFAHSWRMLVDQEGRPFPLHTYPWSTRYKDNDAIFERFVASGLAEAGRPYLRDCVTTEQGDEVFHVDTSELCVRRTIHDQIRFRVEFSLYQIIHGQSDDDCLCEALYRRGIPHACSQAYSLFYRVGGFSNSDDEHLWQVAGRRAPDARDKEHEHGT